ncbi:MAG: PQQ-dependent sugar dehydrogenase, partial [Ardenticatenaceae bacterium]
MRNFIGAILLALLLAAIAIFLLRGQIARRVGVRFPTGQPGEAALLLPEGFTSNIFAGGLVDPRFMTVGGDGTLFVAERGRDRVVALPDHDGDGRADERIVVAEGLDDPSSLAFRPGTTELYVGETSRVSRLSLDGLTATMRETVVADLPRRRVHTTTTVLFGPDGKLYVARGSTCNVCIENDPRLAAVWIYEPDGSNGRLFMTGLRNAVGLAVNPATSSIWASNNGRDLLGNDLPPDTVHILKDGADAGWPRCHAGDIVDPEFGTGRQSCQNVAQPVLEIQAHSAALGLTFYDGERFPAEYEGNLFVALHGSWNRVPPTGYKIVRARVENDGIVSGIEDFATGWLQPNDDSLGRPVDVVVGKDGALLISDDKGGYIY